MIEDICDSRYAEFLEHACKTIVENKPIAVSVSYVTETGAIGTGYFECSMANKLTMAGMMLVDAMMDCVKHNPQWLRETLEEGEENS